MAPTSTLIISLALLVPTTLLQVAGESSGKSLCGPGVSDAFTLLQGSAVFWGGDLTQQLPSMLLTPAVGALGHNSDLTVPIVYCHYQTLIN